MVRCSVTQSPAVDFAITDSSAITFPTERAADPTDTASEENVWWVCCGDVVHSRLEYLEYDQKYAPPVQYWFFAVVVMQWQGTDRPWSAVSWRAMPAVCRPTARAFWSVDGVESVVALLGHLWRRIQNQVSHSFFFCISCRFSLVSDEYTFSNSVSKYTTKFQKSFV